MAYDPRVLQMMQMGVNMASPDQPQPQAFMETGGFRGVQPRRQQQPQQPAGQSANSPANSPTSLGGIPIGLLQMLMLGGKPTVSGTPTAGAAPSGSYGAIPGAQNNFGSMLGNPWGWLGGVGLPTAGQSDRG
jgi:hypothetical protein